MSASVGMEAFREHSGELISAMLQIQNSVGDSKDPQRTYLLAAWQRLCLLMGKDFAPYLNEILPSVFKFAALNPEMGVGEKQADLMEMLSEVGAEKNKEKGVSITTSEIEEKELAIEMLSCFIDKLGGAFSQHIDETTKILLPLTNYTVNDEIRKSVAEAGPGLIKCAKEGFPGQV